MEQTWVRLQADLQGEYRADLQFAEQAEDVMDLLEKF